MADALSWFQSAALMAAGKGGVEALSGYDNRGIDANSAFNCDITLRPSHGKIAAVLSRTDGRITSSKIDLVSDWTFTIAGEPSTSVTLSGSVYNNLIRTVTPEYIRINCSNWRSHTAHSSANITLIAFVCLSQG